MQRGIAIATVVLLLTPGVFASEPRVREPREPRLHLPKIVKHLIGTITTLDEILTGSKP